MYGSTQNTRRKKRRLTDHTEQWTSCSSLKASPDYHDIDIEGEDQETMLKMLQLRYDGNVEAAELEMRVMLSHGVGTWCYVTFGVALRSVLYVCFASPRLAVRFLTFHHNRYSL